MWQPKLITKVPELCLFLTDMRSCIILETIKQAYTIDTKLKQLNCYYRKRRCLFLVISFIFYKLFCLAQHLKMSLANNYKYNKVPFVVMHHIMSHAQHMSSYAFHMVSTCSTHGRHTHLHMDSTCKTNLNIRVNLVPFLWIKVNEVGRI